MPQVSEIVVDPEDGRASVVFFHRSYRFYRGTEHAAVFVANDIEPEYKTPTPSPTPAGATPAAPLPSYPPAVSHLECISGMAEHVKDPFVLFHPVLEEIMVFWSQHHRMSDFDHDIYCNYRSVVDPGGFGIDPITGWHYVVKVTDSIAWRSEFWPYVAVNNSGVSGRDGELYIVSEDYTVPVPTTTWTPTPAPLTPTVTPAHNGGDVEEDDGALIFTISSITPTPCFTCGIIDTTKGYPEFSAKRASIAYFFKEAGGGQEEDQHQLVVAYIRNLNSEEDDLLDFTKNDLGDELVDWTTFRDYTPIPAKYIAFEGARPTIDVTPEGLFRTVFLAPDGKIYETNAFFGDDDWSTPQVIVNTTTQKACVDMVIDPMDDDVYYIAYDEKVNDVWRVYWLKVED